MQGLQRVGGHGLLSAGMLGVTEPVVSDPDVGGCPAWVREALVVEMPVPSATTMFVLKPPCNSGHCCTQQVPKGGRAARDACFFYNEPI